MSDEREVIREHSERKRSREGKRGCGLIERSTNDTPRVATADVFSAGNDDTERAGAMGGWVVARRVRSKCTILSCKK